MQRSRYFYAKHLKKMIRYNPDNHAFLPQLRIDRKFGKTRKRPLPNAALAPMSLKLPSINSRVPRSESYSPGPLYRVTHYGHSPKMLFIHNPGYLTDDRSNSFAEEVIESDKAGILKKEKVDMNKSTSRSALEVRLPSIKLEA